VAAYRPRNFWTHFLVVINIWSIAASKVGKVLYVLHIESELIRSSVQAEREKTSRQTQCTLTSVAQDVKG